MGFRQTHSPEALPASCLFCPGSVREWYIDCEYDIEFHGAMYVCKECMLEMARKAGFYSTEETEKQRMLVVETQERNFELQKRIAGLEKAIEGLMDAGYRPGSRPITINRLGPAPALSDQPTLPGTIDVGNGKRETSEPVDDEGLGELSADVSSEPASTAFKLKL